MESSLEKVELHLSPSIESFARNSIPRRVVRGRLYRAVTQVVGIEGQRFSGYFGVVCMDGDGKDHGTEVGRRIRWLNDFSGIQKEYTLTFRAETDRVIAVYRINDETPVRSACSLMVRPVEEISIEEVSSESVESFDMIQDYEIPRPEELGREEEDVLEANLVWVVGSARGGTTWLGTQLLSHGTNVIDEFNVSQHIGTRMDLVQNDSSRNIDFRTDSGHYIFAKQYRSTWQYYLRKLVLNRIHAQFQDISKKVVIKEPHNIGIPDIISQCFPRSKIILLFRDGRDVVDSTISARTEGGFMAKMGMRSIGEEGRGEFIRKRSEKWVEMAGHMKRAEGIHPRENTCSIRYEDLRADTRGSLERLYKFIAVEISDVELDEIVERYDFENVPKEMKGDGKFYRSATPGRWKKRFDRNEIDVMNEIMGDMLVRLGYTV